MAGLRAELRDLRKWAALNYIAVVKAAKKRNRHLGAACAAGPRRAHALRAVDVLSRQYFFTSPRLAALTTQAEVLAQVSSGEAAAAGRCHTRRLRGTALPLAAALDAPPRPPAPAARRSWRRCRRLWATWCAT